MDLNWFYMLDMPYQAGLILLLILAVIWKLLWYGIALYKTLQLKQKEWFVVLFVAAFVLNDLGILAIIYLIINKDKKIKKSADKKTSKKK